MISPLGGEWVKYLNVILSLVDKINCSNIDYFANAQNVVPPGFMLLLSSIFPHCLDRKGKTSSKDNLFLIHLSP